MIPFRVLMAALFTLIYLYGKLAEDINVAENFRSKQYWNIIMAATPGIALFFWIESIFPKVTGIVIAISLIACVLCIIYRVWDMDIPEEEKPADKMADGFLLKGKKGEIIEEIAHLKRSGDDTLYIGRLFENGESIAIYMDYVDDQAKPGDEFVITDLKGTRIYAKITNKTKNQDE